MKRNDFRILVVDDEKDWVTVNRKALERRGYTVYGASCAQEAVSLVQKHSMHLAFLDVDMPGTDGIELIDMLREHVPDIEVIMLTGYGTADTYSSAKIKGITDFLEKMGPAGDRILGDEMVDCADEVFERQCSADPGTDGVME